MSKTTKLSKKKLKDYINSNGFFATAKFTIEENAPEGVNVPEGAVFFRGIASTGELNRNGYIIREDAWRDAINTYMQNPVILLQHNIDQPIGTCTGARLTENGLEVEGFIFDDLTGGMFGRSLLRALSTGHITEAVEFENRENGQVLTEAEFRALEWTEQFSDKWIMCVTKLDWVEFSLVTIGSNKKALTTMKNAIEKWLGVSANDVDEDGEGDGEEKEVMSTEDSETENVEETQENTVEEESEVSQEGETPSQSTEEVEESSEVAEGADSETQQNTVFVSQNSYEKLSKMSQILAKALNHVAVQPEEEQKQGETDTQENSVAEQKIEEVLENAFTQFPALKAYVNQLAECALTLQNSVNEKQTKINELEDKLSKIPDKRAVLIHKHGSGAQKATEKQKTPLADLIRAAI